MKTKLAVLAIVGAFFVGRHTQAQMAHVGPQIAFKVDHEEQPGHYVLEPMEVRIGYTIFPVEGDNPAPLQINSTAICRVYNEGVKQYMKCGGARYHVSNIGLQPKKEGN
jgi:hypothetical protein